MEYGAKADGITIDSPAVQKAIDTCIENGGGTVFFPKGIYVLATVFLKKSKVFLLLRYAENQMRRAFYPKTISIKTPHLLGKARYSHTNKWGYFYAVIT